MVMRKDLYAIDGKIYRFSSAVFDSLIGSGAKGAERMRSLADYMHVSLSSIKDWRRGAHVPSDIEKVEDIARWGHVDLDSLLVKERNGMSEKLSEKQLNVLCGLWNQAYDFLELCEYTDRFVWESVDLCRIPSSLLHDVQITPDGAIVEAGWEIKSDELHLLTMEAYNRACRRAYPYVGETELYNKLLDFYGIINEVGYGEEDGDWLPDPDMIFEPHEDGYVAPMVKAELKGKKLLDEVSDELVAARETLKG